MAPPMSQAAAARKGKHLEVENAWDSQAQGDTNAVQKTAQKQTAVKKTVTKKTPRKRALAQPKELDLSVTISVSSSDIPRDYLKILEEFIPLDYLKILEEFIEKECISGLCSEGVEEYVKHGMPFAKNRIILTHKNVIERAAIFCKYKMKKQLGSTLPGTLLPMLQSGQYIPSISWVLPVRQGGMEYTKASALWKCMMHPETMTMDDVIQIFFEHTNPGPCLADMGQQQKLATELDDILEGAHCDYVVPDTVVGESGRQLNNVIVINSS